MNVHAASSTYGELIEPATLKIQRVLPGPIERVWDYLTNSELRRKWLAAGDMDVKAGAPFELVWKNDELTDPPGNKPDGFGSDCGTSSRMNGPSRDTTRARSPWRVRRPVAGSGRARAALPS